MILRIVDIIVAALINSRKGPDADTVQMIYIYIFISPSNGSNTQKKTRVKTHNKALIDKAAYLNERNFLIHVLYKDCFWLLKQSDMYVYIS